LPQLVRYTTRRRLAHAEIDTSIIVSSGVDHVFGGATVSIRCSAAPP
jgi:hypothetical protein